MWKGERPRTAKTTSIKNKVGELMRDFKNYYKVTIIKTV